MFGARDDNINGMYFECVEKRHSQPIYKQDKVSLYLLRYYKRKKDEYFWVISSDIDDLTQSICATLKSVGSSYLTCNSKTEHWMEWDIHNGDWVVNKEMRATYRYYKEPISGASFKPPRKAKIYPKLFKGITFERKLNMLMARWRLNNITI